ncbi:NAD(P)-binding protein [Schizophyllum commune Tattone D]|nr:NAD(P)-binding protein [Schizophyllum commune Tattone D]
MSLQRRVALVTGAAQGMGRAIAIRLAKDGLDVGVSDIHSKRSALEDVAKSIESAGGKAVVLPGDVSKEEDVNAMVEGTAAALGGLHVMVANAGVGPACPFIEETVEGFNKTMAINGLSVFLCFKYAAKKILEQGHGEGRLIAASSLAGKMAYPGFTGYNASKFAMRGVVQTAAIELGPHGITANAYAPARTTEVADRVDLSAIAATLPMRRVGQPGDIAALVSYLASVDSGYVTGSCHILITIDGGWRVD